MLSFGALPLWPCAASAAACFLEARRLVIVVTIRTAQITPSDTGMLISGT